MRDGIATADGAEFLVDFVSPLAMTIKVVLHVVGDRLTGTAQAGPFPPSTVVGVRAP